MGCEGVVEWGSVAIVGPVVIGDVGIGNVCGAEVASTEPVAEAPSGTGDKDFAVDGSVEFSVEAGAGIGLIAITGCLSSCTDRFAGGLSDGTVGSRSTV